MVYRLQEKMWGSSKNYVHIFFYTEYFFRFSKNQHSQFVSIISINNP
jgi:hypothetical protein